MPVQAWTPATAQVQREWWRKPWVIATGGVLAFFVVKDWEDCP